MRISEEYLALIDVISKAISSHIRPLLSIFKLKFNLTGKMKKNWRSKWTVTKWSITSKISHLFLTKISEHHLLPTVKQRKIFGWQKVFNEPESYHIFALTPLLQHIKSFSNQILSPCATLKRRYLNVEMTLLERLELARMKIKIGINLKNKGQR